MSAKDLMTSWNLLTKTLTGTIALAAMFVSGVLYFQPAGRAEAQHVLIRSDMDNHHAEDHETDLRASLEAELERVKLAIKFYNEIRSRRALTPDEQTELDYLVERRNQITNRLYDK